MTVFVLGVFTGIVAFIIAILVATKIGYTLVFAWDDSKVKVNVPSADVVEVVRCGECKYQDKGENDCEAWNLCGYRPWLHIPTEDDAFCSKGERKDG